MACIETVDRVIIPQDVIKLISAIYEKKGKDIYYQEVIKKDFSVILKQTIERDTFFLAKLAGLDITDTRMRLIIQKDSKPRNKEEQTLTQMKKALNSIQSNIREFDLTPPEVFKMGNFIYGHKNPLVYETYRNDDAPSLVSQAKKSKRTLFDEVITQYNEYKRKKTHESLILINSFYIDFHNIEPFNDKNEIIGYVLLYTLLIQNEFHAFKYISFFQMVYEFKKEFDQAIVKSSVNYHEGFAQTFHFLRVLLATTERAYERIEDIFRDYEFDKKILKGSNIIATIGRMPEYFTKDDIRSMHPYVSESTINRALQTLRDQGEIKPLGKGRSAKWMRVDMEPTLKIDEEQSFFDFNV